MSVYGGSITTPPQVYAPNAVDPARESLEAFIRQSMESGASFEVGQMIQMSWIWLKVAEDESGMKITAPVHPSMPWEFVDDCSEALNLIVRQRYVTDSFELDPGWCHSRQSAIVIKDLERCSQLFMNRTEPEEGNASGWFIGAMDSELDANAAENLELVSLWELYCTYKEFGDFFLLPENWQVVFESAPVVLRNFERIEPLPGSLFATRYGDELDGSGQ